jgi:hypothetical protein
VGAVERFEIDTPKVRGAAPAGPPDQAAPAVPAIPAGREHPAPLGVLRSNDSGQGLSS